MTEPSNNHQADILVDAVLAAIELERLANGKVRGLREEVEMTRGNISDQRRLELETIASRVVDDTQGIRTLINRILVPTRLSELQDDLGTVVNAGTPAQTEEPTVIEGPGASGELAVPGSVVGRSKKRPRAVTRKMVPTAVDVGGRIGMKIESMMRNTPELFIKALEADADFSERFSNLKVAGQGAMGIVLSAHHTNLDQQVALKFNMNSMDEGLAEMFVNEGKRAAKIKSPNVVQIMDSDAAVIECDGKAVRIPYLAFEFIEGAKDGRFLMEAMKIAGRPFPLEAAIILTKQAALGLAAAHEQDIMHRDVKPENIFVPRDEQEIILAWAEGRLKDEDLIKELKKLSGLKVTDFGLADVCKKGDTSSPESEEAEDEKKGTIMGTPRYIPPEGYAGDVSLPGDVYALGQIFYNLTTGNSGTPLEFSKGLELEKTKRVIEFMAKILKIEAPAVTDIGGKDHDLNRFVKKEGRRGRDSHAMQQKMTAHRAEDRPTIQECLTWFDDMLEEQTRTNLRILKGCVGTLGVVLIGILAALPFGLRHQRHQGLMEGAKTTLDKAREDFERNNWAEVVRTLNDKRGELLGSDLPEDERNPLLEELDALKKESLKRQNAWEFVVKGQKSLEKDPSRDYENAGIFFKKAKEEAPELAHEIEKAAEKMLCLPEDELHTETMKSYHMGHMDNILEQLTELRQMAEFDKCHDGSETDDYRKIAAAWPETKKKLRAKVDSVDLSNEKIKSVYKDDMLCRAHGHQPEALIEMLFMMGRLEGRERSQWEGVFASLIASSEKKTIFLPGIAGTAQTILVDRVLRTESEQPATEQVQKKLVFLTQLINLTNRHGSLVKGDFPDNVPPELLERLPSNSDVRLILGNILPLWGKLSGEEQTAIIDQYGQQFGSDGLVVMVLRAARKKA